MCICPNNELISAYIDHEVPPELSSMIAEHLKTCPQCHTVYTSYTAIDKKLQTLGDTIPFPDFSESFETLMIRRAAVINEKHERNTAGNWFYTSVKVPVPIIAAALTVFVLLPLFFFIKMEYALDTERNSFTPIVPVSLEAQPHIPTLEFYIVTSADEKVYADYQLPPKEFIKNTKFFTVCEFSHFYLQNSTLVSSQAADKILHPVSGLSSYSTEGTAANVQQKTLHR